MSAWLLVCADMEDALGNSEDFALAVVNVVQMSDEADLVAAARVAWRDV